MNEGYNVLITTSMGFSNNHAVHSLCVGFSSRSIAEEAVTQLKEHKDKCQKNGVNVEFTRLYPSL